LEHQAIIIFCENSIYIRKAKEKKQTCYLEKIKELKGG
jgi:hypothetical protein